jgi:hypothetical protein
MSDELRIAFLRRKWDEAERRLIAAMAEVVRLQGVVEKLFDENAGLRADAILRRR